MCYSRSVELSVAARRAVQAGIALIALSGVASAWFFFASQIPSAAFRLDVLPGPVAQLRDATAFLGLLMFALGWLMPAAERTRDATRLLHVLLVGVTIWVIALIYGANTGMLGLQIDDPRKDSRWLLLVRLLGEAVTVLALIVFGIRILRGLRRESK